MAVPTPSKRLATMLQRLERGVVLMHSKSYLEDLSAFSCAVHGGGGGGEEDEEEEDRGSDGGDGKGEEREQTEEEEGTMRDRQATPCASGSGGEGAMGDAAESAGGLTREVLLAALLGAMPWCVRRLQLVEPRRAKWRHVQSFHDPEYVQALMHASTAATSPHYRLRHAEREEREQYGLTVDNPVFRGLDSYLLRMTGATLHAAMLLSTRKASVAINWGGGRHHALRDKASGFCYVNDCVLALEHLTRVFPRVLYIDIDCHHSDGVERSFYRTARVLHVSFHVRDPGFFPGTGPLEDTGAGQGKGHNLNIPFRPGVQDAQFVDVFDIVFDRIVQRYQPACIVFQCGADCLSGDPIGKMNLTTQAVGHCTERIVAQHLESHRWQTRRRDIRERVSESDANAAATPTGGDTANVAPGAVPSAAASATASATAATHASDAKGEAPIALSRAETLPMSRPRAYTRLVPYRPNLATPTRSASLPGRETPPFDLAQRGPADEEEVVDDQVPQPVPVLILGGGGYRADTTARCWAVATAVASGLPLRSMSEFVPQHAHFAEYGPDFRMHTRGSVTMENQNTAEYIHKLKQRAVHILEQIPLPATPSSTASSPSAGASTAHNTKNTSHA